LVHARAAVRDLAALYDSAELLIGTEATLESVSTRIGQADVVHLAAHAELREDGLSLRLSDDTEIDAATISALDFSQAELVFLAACTSGYVRSSAGGHLLGLPGAVLAHGVNYVVATKAQIDDRAAGLLSVSFHRLVKEGCSPPEAAMRARRHLRETHSILVDIDVMAPWPVLEGWQLSCSPSNHSTDKSHDSSGGKKNDVATH